jgi:hypothetical protein
MSFKFNAACLFLLFATSQFSEAKKQIDYTHYDSPLYTQVVNRVREKILLKLSKGDSGKSRFFMIGFAYEDDTNQAEQSHTFGTMVRIDPNHKIEHFNISWLPDRFRYDPTLPVFDPWISIFFPKMNKIKPEKGRNFDLKETLALAIKSKESAEFHKAVGMWGPYEVKEEFFKEGLKRKDYLEHGNPRPQYVADDRLYRKANNLAASIAFNCYHAVASLEFGFPKGGFLDTGLKMWGLNATAHNLSEYKLLEKKRAALNPPKPPLLLDQVDEKNDVYGFVYIENKNDRNVKNPFQNASAYYR